MVERLVFQARLQCDYKCTRLHTKQQSCLWNALMCECRNAGWQLDWSALSVLDGDSKRIWIRSKYSFNCWVPKLNIIFEWIQAAVSILKYHGCNAVALLLIASSWLCQVIIELVLHEHRTVLLHLGECGQNVQWRSDLLVNDDERQPGIREHKCCLHCASFIAKFSLNR